MEFLIGLLPIIIASVLGWLILTAVGGARFAAASWHLFYPVGAGFLTLGLFVMSLSGVMIQLGSVAGLSAGMILPLAVLLRYRDRMQDDLQGSVHLARPKPISLLNILGIGVIGLLVLAAFTLSLSRAYSSWDSMAIWSVKGYGIAREGTVLAGRSWGSQSLRYPLNLPLQITLFDLLGGDWLPHSKLINPLYFLSLIVGLHRYLRRQTSDLIAKSLVLLIAASPVIFDHSTNGYANLPFSAYVVLGFLALIDGWRLDDQTMGLLGGLLLGLAIWTRPEGLYFVGLGGAALWLTCRSSGTSRPAIARWVLPILLLGLPWQAFTVLGGYQQIAGASLTQAIQSWARLDFHMANAYWILRYFVWQALQLEYWGIIVPAIALALLFVAVRRRFEISSDQKLVLAAGSSLLLTAAVYFYLAAFRTNLDYILSTSVERIVMPAMILLTLGLGSVAAPLIREDEC